MAFEASAPYQPTACFFGFMADKVPPGRPIIRCKAAMPPSPPPPPPRPPPPSPSPSPPPPPNVLLTIRETSCSLGGHVQFMSEAPQPATPAEPAHSPKQLSFRVAVMLRWWQPGTRLRLGLRGRGLRVLEVSSNAAYLYVDGRPDLARRPAVMAISDAATAVISHLRSHDATAALEAYRQRHANHAPLAADADDDGSTVDGTLAFSLRLLPVPRFGAAGAAAAAAGHVIDLRIQVIAPRWPP